MEQESLVASLRLLAQQCLRISPELNQLYLDQMAIIGHLNAQNLIKIQQDQCRIELLDGLFYIQFHTPYALDSGAAPALVDSHFYFQQCNLNLFKNIEYKASGDPWVVQRFGTCLWPRA